jgi:hypothetical protein
MKIVVSPGTEYQGTERSTAKKITSHHETFASFGAHP